MQKEIKQRKGQIIMALKEQLLANTVYAETYTH